jgi:indoleamine 2,3-dioxygenase
MIPPIPQLEDYGLSPEHGFLPDQPPLAYLSDSYYAPWETLVANLEPLTKSRKIRDAVDSLPVLSPDGLISDVERRRAYMILGFFAHSYIWGGVDACEVCVDAPNNAGFSWKC